MRILILLILLSAILLVGCNSHDTHSWRGPVNNTYMLRDKEKNMDCAALKEEMAQLKTDIRNKLKQADKSKSGNLFLGLNKKAVDTHEGMIQVLREKYDAFLLFANNKGCVVRRAPSKISGKSDTEKLPLACKYCGPSDSNEWQHINGQWMCNDCYKKFHSSK